jgi:hypothetical protein
MIHLFLIAASVLFFALLCAANPRHQADLLGSKLPPYKTPVLRAAACAVAAVAIFGAFWRLGWGYGLVELLGMASIGAVLSVAALTSRTQKPRR